MFDLFELYIQNIPNLNRKRKLDVILRGINIDNEECTYLNITLTKAVQNFIISTERVTTFEDKD